METRHLHVYDEDGEPSLIAWFDDFAEVHPFMALSNFYEGEPLHLSLVDDTFATGEHAFAAMKAYHGGKTAQYHRIKNADSPGEAKALGQMCELRPDWEAVKYDVMMAILREKFTVTRVEGDVLLDTMEALLVEGTYWDDRVWGVSLFSDRSPLLAPGRNWLGTMLMARRAELRAEKLYNHVHNTGSYNELFAIKRSV